MRSVLFIMENTEKVLGLASNSQDLQPFVGLDGGTQQKRFGAYIPSLSARAQKSELERFEEAAHEEDHHKFNALIKGIDLSDYLPDEITVLIDYCLSLDMIPAAFELAAKAVKLYPANAKFESAYKALNAPKFIGTRQPQATGMEKSQNWFKENSSHYKGKWVAVNNGRLLAEADSLRELKNKIDENDMNPSTVIEKVFNQAQV